MSNATFKKAATWTLKGKAMHYCGCKLESHWIPLNMFIMAATFLWKSQGKKFCFHRTLWSLQWMKIRRLKRPAALCLVSFRRRTKTRIWIPKSHTPQVKSTINWRLKPGVEKYCIVSNYHEVSGYNFLRKFINGARELKREKQLLRNNCFPLKYVWNCLS